MAHAMATCLPSVVASVVVRGMLLGTKRIVRGSVPNANLTA